MSDVTVTSYKCSNHRKGLKGRNVNMTSKGSLMLLFDLSGSHFGLHTKFQLTSVLKNDRIIQNFTFLLSHIQLGTFCNFAAMVTTQNVTNSYDL